MRGKRAKLLRKQTLAAVAGKPALERIFKRLYRQAKRIYTRNG